MIYAIDLNRFDSLLFVDMDTPSLEDLTEQLLYFTQWVSLAEALERSRRLTVISLRKISQGLTSSVRRSAPSELRNTSRSSSTGALFEVFVHCIYSFVCLSLGDAVAAQCLLNSWVAKLPNSTSALRCTRFISLSSSLDLSMKVPTPTMSRPRKSFFDATFLADSSFVFLLRR
jgi:hypothetical protein